MIATPSSRTRRRQPARRSSAAAGRKPNRPFGDGAEVMPVKRTTSGTPVQPAPAPIPTEGRAANGRFTKGNRGGPGNPFARRVAALRSALLATVSEGDVAAIGRRLACQAKRGDVAAAKVLLSYLIGRPAEAVDPDRLGIEEMRLYAELPTGEEATALATGRLDPEAACELVRTLLPLLTGGFFKQLAALVAPGGGGGK